jgi:subtilisin family serine protease
VRFAELNHSTDAPEARHVSVWAIGGDAGVWQGQWAPQLMGLPAAHAVSTGAGVRVAVLDTGADLVHPALAARWARRADGSLLGRDFVDDDADPGEAGAPGSPGYGHGTHVAGLVALTAPGATLMPVRVLDAAGRGNIWVLAEAVAWATDPDGDPTTDDGAHVINLSLGTTTPTSLMRTVEALASCRFVEDDDEFDDPGFDADRARCAQGHRVTLVAAAGNAGSATEVLYPAAEAQDSDTVLAVTAHTAQRQLAFFANRGPAVQLAAPGEGIVSTVPGGWGVWSGTSMAAPLASGVAALVLATPSPSANGALGPRLWTAKDVVQRLNDRSAELCAGTPVRGLHAAAAVLDTTAPDASCGP